jgi:hypothetical protein
MLKKGPILGSHLIFVSVKHRLDTQNTRTIWIQDKLALGYRMAPNIWKPKTFVCFFQKAFNF